MKIGIVGPPNVGKSTLFQALTKIQVDIASYPFTTINPNMGLVNVPDERFDKLVELAKPQHSFPAVIEFADIAGLVKGAHRGEGLGNQFLSHLYTVDAILFLLRCFRDPNIAVSIEDPREQLAILKEELAQKDSSRASPTTPLLSTKPTLVVCNIKESSSENVLYDECDLKLDVKLELEATELSESDRQELNINPLLPQLITLAYRTLNLITFYTIKGGREARAWAVANGSSAPQAGRMVHSDFEEKFIRAEVIPYDKLLEAGSWPKARQLGWLRTEGKEYVVKDGDVVEFKI